ncbi:hypothetical protein KY334_03355 [Candidatus Woesearchaeota archaeon]|nr:hypothetical protein [Candidatus Woesearchaeota archaeon]
MSNNSDPILLEQRVLTLENDVKNLKDIVQKFIFKKDLSVGQTIEKKILKYVRKTYPKAYLIDGYHKEYDIFIPEKRKGIEIKYDKKSEKTGNCFIEISSNGKPSGIMVTKAWLWFIVTGNENELIIIKPETILEIVKDVEVTKGISGGDNYEKERYLVRMDTIRKKGRVIEDYTK